MDPVKALNGTCSSRLAVRCLLENVLKYRQDGLDNNSKAEELMDNDQLIPQEVESAFVTSEQLKSEFGVETKKQRITNVQEDQTFSMETD